MSENNHLTQSQIDPYNLTTKNLEVNAYKLLCKQKHTNVNTVL